MTSNDSLIKSVTITRSDAANSQNRPIQVSQNQQFAINTATHLTIFEPKLPSLNQGITAIKNVRILNPKDMFSIVNILNSELKELLPIRNFSVLTFDNLDEPFSLSNIDDPIIVQHQWSPNGSHNRDNYLGVLFNTGELLVLQRQTQSVDDYVVKFNLFETLVHKYKLRVDNEQNYVIPSSNVFQCMKIKTFAFSEIDSTLWLSLINAKGDIILYAEEDNELVLKYEIHTELNLIKQIWSDWKETGSASYSSHLSVVASDNSVYYYDFEYKTETKTLQASDLNKVSGATRFKNSQNEWLESMDRLYLLNTFTGYIQLTDITESTTVREKLESPATVSGIVSYPNNDDNITIILSYELGSFESFEYNLVSSKITKITVDNALTSYVGKSLQSFQMINASAEDTGNDDNAAVKKEDDSAGSGNGNDTFRLYLDPNIEGQFVIYGMESIGGGSLVLLYKIVPKNVLYYQTESQGEIEVGFIRLEDYNSEPVSLVPSRTPLSYLIELWINRYHELPILVSPRTGADLISMESKIESIHKYIEAIQSFKQANFVNFSLNLSIAEDLKYVTSDLPSTLVKSYNNNEIVYQVQLLFNYLIIVHNSLVSIDAVDAVLETYIKSIEIEMINIEFKLRMHLSRIIMCFMEVTDKETFTEFDKFLLIQHCDQLGWTMYEGVLRQHNIKESKIIIKTKFFEECFEVETYAGGEHLPPKQIASVSYSQWPTCQLTGFPLLQLNNRKDELGQFNYILNDFREDDRITNDLLTTIQFCYITGNRTFKLR